MTEEDYTLVKDLLRPLERELAYLQRQVDDLKNDVRDVEREVSRK